MSAVFFHVKVHSYTNSSSAACLTEGKQAPGGLLAGIQSLLGGEKPGYLSITNDSDPENHLGGQKDVKAYRNHNCEHAGNI